MDSRQPAFDCEEVLLPESNALNGVSGENDGNEIEYLEEHDPMSEEVDESQQDENATEEEEEETTEDNPTTESIKASTAKTGCKPHVLPKKRKNAADLDAEATTPPPTKVAGSATKPKSSSTTTTTTLKSTTTDDEEAASTSRAAAAKADNQVDEEQCRVCTTKVGLVSLFKKMESQQTIADMLMTICPNVSIALKDFMPQFICNPCLDNVTIAIQLKTQCETTERELRKKLSRSKNKVRRPVGYVTIDATIDSDPPSDEEPNDDVEFKVSDEASASAYDDSEDSDFSGKKRLPRGSTGGRRGRRKQVAAPTLPKMKKQQKTVKREVDEDSSDDGKRKKPKKSTNAETPATEFPCDECEQVFQRKLSLVLHKKAHNNDRTLINCEICGRQFKMQGAYRTHLQRHKEESQGHACDKCDEVYASKADLKRHLAEDHDEPDMVYACKKCQRTFVSKTRLEKHTARCPGFPVKQKRTEFEGHVVGQDLFKTVAPLTTTYWSDSFSD